MSFEVYDFGPEEDKEVIINNASCDGLVGEPVRRLTVRLMVAWSCGLGMALDCAKYGARVNCICPGYVMSRVLEIDLPQGTSLGKYLKITSKWHR